LDAVFLVLPKLVAAASRVRSLTERVMESAARGDAGLLVADILELERDGTWQERKVLFNFVCDMVGSVALTDSETGERSMRTRWHPSTKRVFSVLQLMGGPKLNSFLHETLGATHSLRTIGR